jgi:hypothetical protein
MLANPLSLPPPTYTPSPGAVPHSPSAGLVAVHVGDILEGRLTLCLPWLVGDLQHPQVMALGALADAAGGQVVVGSIG